MAGTLNTHYAQSSKVKVFPTTKRPDFQKDSSFLTEANLVSLVNRLLDENTFVISYNGSTDIIKFNINGYYFQVKDVSQLVSTPAVGDSLYAGTRLVKTGEYNELYGTDESNFYTGLYFSVDSTQLPAMLEILSYTAEGWAVPPNSYYKYNSRGLYGNIDCGEI